MTPFRCEGIVCRWKLLYGIAAYNILLDDATVFCGNLSVTLLLPCQRNCEAVTASQGPLPSQQIVVEGGGRGSKEGRGRSMTSDKKICGRIFAF